MPNSLKCKIKHLCYNGTITERERDRILKALEQESILTKIRAEIEQYIDKEKLRFGGQFDSGLNLALKIIDKYKIESSEE